MMAEFDGTSEYPCSDDKLRFLYWKNILKKDLNTQYIALAVTKCATINHI